jgi:hypothetical protein
MAHYGLFFGDTGSSGWAIQMESGSTYTSFGAEDQGVAFAKKNGWTDNGNGHYSGNVADGIPWDRLEMVDPCVSQGTC